MGLECSKPEVEENTNAFKPQKALCESDTKLVETLNGRNGEFGTLCPPDRSGRCFYPSSACVIFPRCIDDAVHRRVRFSMPPWPPVSAFSQRVCGTEPRFRHLDRRAFWCRLRKQNVHGSSTQPIQRCLSSRRRTVAANEHRRSRRRLGVSERLNRRRPFGACYNCGTFA
ncbi:unnamed protein product, partial [Phaeothamnion confervicola]